MGVVVVIVSYNGEKYLNACIDYVSKDPAVSKVIVVDNNSTDNSLSILRNLNKVTLVELSKNVGFGQANNIGIELGLKENSDYFFLLNQDAYTERDSVTKLVQTHKRNSDYGIIAPIQLNGIGDSIDEKFYDYLFYQNRTFGYKLYKNDLTGVLPVDFVNAAAWLVSKECLMKVGGFDPVFFHTGEDDDYVQRVKHWGFKVGIAPEVSVRHDRPQVSWVSQTTSVERELTLNILGLKNINRSFKENLVQILKKKSYYVAYDIAKFRFNAVKVKCLSFFQALKLYASIKESRKKSMKEFAFLKKM